MADEIIAKERSFNFATFQTIFDLGWKGLLLLWFAFQFYNNQDSLLKDRSRADARITKLETDFNKMDRDLVEQKAYNLSLKEQLDNDRQFYLQTRK
jgi:hypothetical protein